jgi:hypothetical protein
MNYIELYYEAKKVHSHLCHLYKKETPPDEIKLILDGPFAPFICIKDPVLKHKLQQEFNRKLLQILQG